MRPPLERSAVSTSQLMVDGMGSSRRVELAMDGSVRFVNDGHVPSNDNHGPDTQPRAGSAMEDSNSYHLDDQKQQGNDSEAPSNIPVPLTTPFMGGRPSLTKAASARSTSEVLRRGRSLGAGSPRSGDSVGTIPPTSPTPTPTPTSPKERQSRPPQSPRSARPPRQRPAQPEPCRQEQPQLSTPTKPTFRPPPPPPPKQQQLPRSPSPRKQRFITPRRNRSPSPAVAPAQPSSSPSLPLPPASPRTPSRSRRMPPLPTRGLSSSGLLRSRKSTPPSTRNNQNDDNNANENHSPPRRRSRSLGIPGRSRSRSRSRSASRRRGVGEFVSNEESERVSLIQRKSRSREEERLPAGSDTLHRYKSVPPTVASPKSTKNDSSATAATTPSCTGATHGSGTVAGEGRTVHQPSARTNNTEMYSALPHDGIMDTNMGGTPVDLANMVQSKAATTPMTAGIEMDENEVTLHLSCQHLPLKNITGGNGSPKAVYCRVFLHRPIPNAQQRNEEPHSFRQTLLRGGTSPQGGNRRGMYRTSSSSVSSLTYEDDARDDVGHESELRKSHYFDEPPMGSREIGQTEVIYDTPHPRFATPLHVTGLALGKVHDVIVCVYVETKLIGTCTLSLERDLLCNDMLRFSSSLQCGGSVSVAVKPTVTNYHHLAFQLSVVGLQKEQGRIMKLLRGRKNLNTYLVMSYRKRKPASQPPQEEQQQLDQQLPNLGRSRSVSFSPQQHPQPHGRSSHGSSRGMSVHDEDDEDDDNDDDAGHGAKARSGKVKDWAWEIIWRSELILDDGAPRFRFGHFQPMRLNGGDLDTPVRFSLMDWNDKVRGHKKVGTARTKLSCLRGESVISLQRKGSLVGFLNIERSTPTIAPSVMEYMYSRHHAMNIVFATDYVGSNSFYGALDGSDGSSVVPPPENGADYSPSLSSVASSTGEARQKTHRNRSSSDLSMSSPDSAQKGSQRRRGPRLQEYTKAMNVIGRFFHSYTNIQHVHLLAELDESESMTKHEVPVGSSGLPGVESILRELGSNDERVYDPARVLRLVDKGTGDASTYAARHSDRGASAYSILIVLVQADQTSQDLVALLERLCLASFEPLSIIFVGVGAPSHMSLPHDGEDSLDILNNIATQLASPTLVEFARHVAHYVPFYPYEDDPDVFIRKLFSKLSCQMLQYRLAMQILG